MKLLSEWTDDHLPCISFEHTGKFFALCWTDSKLIGKLSLVEDGTVTLEQVLKQYPDLLQILNSSDPLDVTSLPTLDGEREGDTSTYTTDAGSLDVFASEAAFLSAYPQS